MRKYFFLAILILGLAAIILATILVPQNSTKGTQSQLILQAPETNINGFQRAEGLRQFTFPEDHGAHPDFQTEWWYYTGNLESEAGQRFGYQLTFFRRALLPGADINKRQSNWGANQVYLAHFAISDIAEQEHQAFERLSRGAAGLAGAQATPFQVWLDDWRVEEITDPGNCPGASPCVYRLIAAQETIKLELILMDRKGPIPQGELGLSRKGAQSGQASYYYSLTPLESSGTITVGKQLYAVNGWSWMDHEFSTSALSKQQIGWDWFSIQFDDDSQLMVFQIRRSDGSIDPFSSGTLIAPDGSTTHLEKADFTIQVKDTWKSPHSKAIYPASWQIQIPSQDLILKIDPYLADQELNVSYSYWEGTVYIEGLRDRQILTGHGYVELTGYSGSMGGEF